MKIKRLIGATLLGAIVGTSALGVDLENKAYASGGYYSFSKPNYNDGVYNYKTTSTTFGYKVGKTVYSNQVVKRVLINSKGWMNSMSKLSDSILYERANNNNLINYVLVTDDVHGYVKTPIKKNYSTDRLFNQEKIISNSKLNKEFVKLVNKDRERLGRNAVSYSLDLKKGVSKRAFELAKNGDIRVNGKSHVRLNGDSYVTAFNYLPNYKTRIGENTAELSYNGNPYIIVSEKKLAEEFYRIWKNSEIHNKVMMNPNIKHMSLSIKTLPSDNEFFNHFTGVLATDKY